MVLGSSRLIARVATIHLGHPGVHEDHLGAQAAAKFKGLHAILPFSHHLKVRVLLEHPSQRAPIQGMVIRDYYATAKGSMFHARRQDAPPSTPTPSFLRLYDNPAASFNKPVALRPRLTPGLPLSNTT